MCNGSPRGSPPGIPPPCIPIETIALLGRFGVVHLQNTGTLVIARASVDFVPGGGNFAVTLMKSIVMKKRVARLLFFLNDFVVPI